MTSLQQAISMMKRAMALYEQAETNRREAAGFREAALIAHSDHRYIFAEWKDKAAARNTEDADWHNDEAQFYFLQHERYHC